MPFAYSDFERTTWRVAGETPGGRSKELQIMVNTANNLTIQVGDAVYSADDHKIGTVKAFDANFITVEHGLLLKSEYYIPITAVNAYSNGSIYLNVTKDEVGSRGWDQPPLIETDAGNPPLLP